MLAGCVKRVMVSSTALSSNTSSSIGGKAHNGTNKAGKLARSAKITTCPGFVDKVHTYDYWTRCADTVIEREFQRAKLLLMVDKQPALCSEQLLTNTTTGQSQTLQTSLKLRLFDCQELQQKLSPYGLEIGTLNSALLDICLPDEGGDFKAIFGVSIKLNSPPQESGISNERQLEELAQELRVQFMPLRRAMLTMEDPAQRELLAKFQIITRWYRLYVHCPRCTTLLKMKASKFSAQCPRCDQEFYPTMSPVAITLIRNESNERALLVRHKGTTGVFTCIAGFCSPGESLEQTVVREVAEEVGIQCWDIRALGGSQPWPLPTGSLMVSFVATASEMDELHLSIAELDSAKWFGLDEIADALRRTEEDSHMEGIQRYLASSRKNPEERLQLRYIPPKGAIAHQIIKNWVQRKF